MPHAMQDSQSTFCINFEREDFLSMSQYSFYQIWILHAIKSYGVVPLNRLYRILTGNRTMSTLIGVTEDKTEVFLRVYLI